jgi:hypothetical protein
MVNFLTKGKFKKNTKIFYDMINSNGAFIYELDTFLTNYKILLFCNIIKKLFFINNVFDKKTHRTAPKGLYQVFL